MSERKTTTPETIRRVLELFYRTKLRMNEKVVDNRDIAIANEIGVDKALVNRIIDRSLNKKFKKVNERVL